MREEFEFVFLVIFTLSIIVLTAIYIPYDNPLQEQYQLEKKTAKTTLKNLYKIRVLEQRVEELKGELEDLYNDMPQPVNFTTPQKVLLERIIVKGLDEGYYNPSTDKFDSKATYYTIGYRILNSEVVSETTVDKTEGYMIFR